MYPVTNRIRRVLGRVSPVAHSNNIAATHVAASTVAATVFAVVFSCCGLNPAVAQSHIIRNITQENERLEMTVDSSRILTLEKRIPRMVVNNPELVTVTPISANQVQIAARKPGVTQINLWDEDDQVYTVDVSVYGDVKELENALARLFPSSSIKVMRLSGSLVLEGFVERAEAVSPIIRLAEDYAPKIVNNIQVGGVQQIMLKVKVMEVSRTKLRALGTDFSINSGSFSLVQSLPFITTAGDTVGVVTDNGRFNVFLEALQQNSVVKVLADPVITTVSGRPAQFVSGGEAPYVSGTNDGAGGAQQIQVGWRKFGTIVDFLPIVLGDGRIRLEVRPQVSEIDPSISLLIGNNQVPGFRSRSVDTGVELQAGQTLALAGLVQTRVDANERGLPYLMDLPYVGAAFRRVRETVEEVELLILVTPEFADGMDPHQVPPCGPGMETVSPTNCQLYWGSHLEMPAPGICGPGMYGSGACSPYNGYGCPPGPQGAAYATDEPYMIREHQGHPMHGGERILGPAEGYPAQPSREPMPAPNGNPGFPTTPTPALNGASSLNQNSYGTPNRTASQQNSHNEYDPQPTNQPFRRSTSTPGLIGPMGYDVE